MYQYIHFVIKYKILTFISRWHWYNMIFITYYTLKQAAITDWLFASVFSGIKRSIHNIHMWKWYYQTTKYKGILPKNEKVECDSSYHLFWLLICFLFIVIMFIYLLNCAFSILGSHFKMHTSLSDDCWLLCIDLSVAMHF